MWAAAENCVVSSGHNYSRRYARTHVGIMLQGRVSERSELRCDARAGTYSTKPWAAEPILLRSGKTLRPVLQMVLEREERRHVSMLTPAQAASSELNANIKMLSSSLTCLFISAAGSKYFKLTDLNSFVQCC